MTKRPRITGPETVQNPAAAADAYPNRTEAIVFLGDSVDARVVEVLRRLDPGRDLSVEQWLNEAIRIDNRVRQIDIANVVLREPPFPASS